MSGLKLKEVLWTCNPQFAVGTEVTAAHSQYPYFCAGQKGTVVEVSPPLRDLTFGFTWPAYITVLMGSGEKVTCYPWRFKEAK